VYVPSIKAQEAPSIVGSSPLYGLSGGTGWINSQALTAEQLKGKVVLVDFWDYSCINCIRAIPYVRAWAEKYKDSGLVVIGVRTPEFDVESRHDSSVPSLTRNQLRREGWSAVGHLPCSALVSLPDLHDPPSSSCSLQDSHSPQLGFSER
jgi:thiol-disulfide isomerase/thioredoxin